jgi:ribosome-binding protein aMBF1 (putative translation factor)
MPGEHLARRVYGESPVFNRISENCSRFMEALDHSKLSHRDLAEKLGCDHVTVAQWADGRTLVPRRYWKKVEQILCAEIFE